MLQEISARFQCGLNDVFYIGDTISDVRAALAAGAKPVLVRTGKGEKTLATADANELANIPVYADLAAATDVLLMEN